MKLHANAALSLTQRRRMVLRVIEQGWSIKAAAAAAETDVSKTCGKWVARYRRGSESGLLDRSSAPQRVANRTDERRIEAIAALRRLRFTGPEIAELLGMALSTVSGILTRIGMGRLGRLGLEPAERYERERPGRADPHRRQEARAHPGRRRQARPDRRASTTRRAAPTRDGKRRSTVGWDYVHVAIDDCHPPGLRRGAARREGHHRDRVPRPRGRVLRAATASPSSA